MPFAPYDKAMLDARSLCGSQASCFCCQELGSGCDEHEWVNLR